ncbi:MAG TPA: penicillin-binding transpeptidase domain-containing protein, partial [Candidatus Kapabacteria bacterium]|nr:penicillin-binding transpeptidase domain-containing protein [Candidatus Kapabacteria bacterium]
TAQVTHGNPNAWFIAYAPADHPKIAVAVMAENAGWGAETAAPIASKLIQYYLTGSRPDAPAAPADSLKAPAEQPLHAEAIH